MRLPVLTAVLHAARRVGPHYRLGVSGVPAKQMGLTSDEACNASSAIALGHCTSLFGKEKSDYSACSNLKLRVKLPQQTPVVAEAV